ncbi:MAG: O-antigen ligase family protein [Candidatus Hadarchaeum sp.]|uniref:O-antigen ligase family protein n=1 Tax=Candidatus Hadarchaeum sp. TaxID=2883567 RepID=UPI003173972D
MAFDNKVMDRFSRIGTSKLGFVGIGIILLFAGVAILSLQTPTRTYLFPLAPYLMLGLQLGAAILLFPVSHISVRPASLVLLLSISVLLIFSLVSSFWSDYSVLVFRRSLMILVPSLLVGILTFMDSRPAVTFFWLAKFLSLFGTIGSFVGLVIYFRGDMVYTDLGRVQVLVLGPLRIGQPLYGKPPFLRISSFFGNPNSLASWLLVTLPMTAYVLLSTRSLQNKLWLTTALIVQLCALSLTFSRAGISATFLALAIVWCLSANNRCTRVKRSFTIGLATLCAVLLLTLLLPKLSQYDLRFSFSLNLRELAWLATWEQIQVNPFFGVGFGVANEAVLNPEGIDIGVHNIFLTLWSEVGIVGLSIFIWMWLFPVWYAWKVLKHASKNIRLIISVCLAIVLALLPHQLFEGQLLRYGFHTIMWVYLLALMVHPKLRG